jgi:hypothetical protein
MNAARRWLILAWIGFALVVLPMAVIALEVIDKPDFGRLVGPMFLPTITISIILGGLLVLIAAFKLPDRKNWRGYLLMAWGVIALGSPAAGAFLIMLPWSILVLMLPLVVWILVSSAKRAPIG